MRFVRLFTRFLRITFETHESKKFYVTRTWLRFFQTLKTEMFRFDLPPKRFVKIMHVHAPNTTFDESITVENDTETR